MSRPAGSAARRSAVSTTTAASIPSQRAEVFAQMPSEASWELRKATAEDVGMIRELVRSAYAKWVPVIGREPQPMSADYARAVQEHQIDLAFMDTRLVGLIETIVRGDHLWIEN